VRPSENWRRHLLLLGSSESEFITNLKGKKGFARKPRRVGTRDTESTEIANEGNSVERALLRRALCPGPESYKRDITVANTILSR
jgi:hypothetical protein